MSEGQDFSRRRLERLWALDHPGVSWRHDVDYDVRCAALMAMDEERAGIRSTYYIRLRGDAYNIYERKTRRHLDVILHCGQHLALHLDLGLPRDAEPNLAHVEQQVWKDLQILRAEIPVVRLDSYTVHAPPKRLPLAPAAYIADSRGIFWASPEDALLSGEPLTVNLHPEWWYLPTMERAVLRERERVAP